jgi:hypothetical protein
MAEFEDFFRTSASTTQFFDEGPRIPHVKPNVTLSRFVNTSSIVTIEIDGYRQGVEMTQMKHFDAGLVKIHAGEPGHVLRKNRYGMDKNFRPEPRFEELDYFNPVTFLRAQEIGDPLLLNILTFPIITGDNDQIENFVFDGIIEPLPIREIASFFSIETPFQARNVRGALMAGNSDQTTASDLIVTVDYFEPEIEQIEYVDMAGSDMPSQQFAGFFRFDKSQRRPFNDTRFPRNVQISTTYSTAMDAAISLMSGSTDNYVSFKQYSSNSGFCYDNTSIGVDSIAFGGMTY